MILRAAPLLVGVAVVAGCSDSGATFDRNSQMGANPVLPEQNAYLLPPMHVAKAVGWTDGATPTVPAGFTVKPLATGLKHPRNVYVLPNGDQLVVESNGPGTEPVERPKDIIMPLVQNYAGAGAKGGNRITLLRDTNGDGIPDVRTTFIDHLYSPFGVALVGGDLYVANTDALLRFPYRTGDTKITIPGTKIIGLPGPPIDHHWTKSIAASPDGRMLYIGVGSNSNITENGAEAERGRASVWEIDRATGRYRIYAGGLRNPTSLGFEPVTKKLWAVVNERDELGPNLVPDYLTSVKEGGFYGWPYSYYGQHVDPRVQPQRPDLVATAIPPDYALSSHVAPLGMTFYGSALLRGYAGGLFIGEHGSWDRGQYNGYQVVYVPFRNGRPVGKARPFVTGFINASGQAQGRPVGVSVDKVGALLIADDLGGTVWRVTPAAHTASVATKPNDG
jgi:glucose/arabinose dehydrogenase